MSPKGDCARDVAGAAEGSPTSVLSVPWPTVSLREPEGGGSSHISPMVPDHTNKPQNLGCPMILGCLILELPPYPVALENHEP